MVVIIFVMLMVIGMHAIIMFIIPNLSGKENLFGQNAGKLATDQDYFKGICYTLYAVAFCDLVCELMFTAILICGAFVVNLGPWFMPVFLCALFIPIIILLIKIHVLKEKIIHRI